MKDLSGKKLGQYELVEPIGRGGMASVYKAYQPRMKRYVGVKVLPDVLAADPNFFARFEREAQTVAQLEHRYILPVYEFGEEGTTAYIVMRYIDTGTLADRMEKGDLSYKEIGRITEQLCEALEYAHENGIIHRDLKPANIFLDQHDNVLLGDFGIAKISEGTQELTGGSIIGTPAYMSPEQGQGDALDGRSDIYAVGVIIYELCTGKQPYQAETPMGVVIKHITEVMPDPRSIKPNLPTPIAEVIIKATSKNKDHRYATPKIFAQALKDAIHNPQPTTNSGTIAFDAPPETPITAPIMPPLPPQITEPRGKTPVTKTTPISATPELPPMTASTSMLDNVKAKMPAWAWAVIGSLFLFTCLICGWAISDDTENPQTTPTVDTQLSVTTDPDSGNVISLNPTAPPVEFAPTEAPVATEPAANNNSGRPLPSFSSNQISALDVVLNPGEIHKIAFLSLGQDTFVAEINPNFDAVLQLFNAETNEFIMEVDETEIAPETLQFITSADTIAFFYLAISGFDGASGSYHLNTSYGSMIGARLFGDETASGAMKANDSLGYMFLSESGVTTYNFEVVPEGQFDVMVNIYDEASLLNEQPLFSVDDKNPGFAETVSFDASPQILYLVEIIGANDEAGRYTLHFLNN